MIHSSDMLSYAKKFIHHLAACMYPIPMPCQTCSSSKGADSRKGIALLILTSGSSRRCVVSAMPHSIYPWERDLVYIAEFFEKAGKRYHSTSCYTQNILQCLQDHVKFSRQFSRLLGTSCCCIRKALSPYLADSLCIIFCIIVIPDLRVTTSWHYKCELAKQKVLLLVLEATDISEYYEYWSSGFKNLMRSHFAFHSICNRIAQVSNKAAFLHQFNVDSSIKYLAMLCRVFGLHCNKKGDNH
jgi:hypothetical protein